MRRCHLSSTAGFLVEQLHRQPDQVIKVQGVIGLEVGVVLLVDQANALLALVLGMAQ